MAIDSRILKEFHELKFPASTEVSHDEAKMRGRRETSAGPRRVSYHACAGVSLTTSDVFVSLLPLISAPSQGNTEGKL